MTTEDAKTKWCPFARCWEYTLDQSVNRDSQGRPIEGALCLADDCMLWVNEGRAQTGRTVTEQKYNAQTNLYRLEESPEWADIGSCGAIRVIEA